MKTMIGVMVAVGVVTASAAVKVGENILLNPGFTAMNGEPPQYWDPGKCGAVVTAANAMEPGARPAVTFTGLPENKGINLRQYGLRLKAHGRYRLSALMRATDFKPGGRNGFKIANNKWRWGFGFNLPAGTYDWKRVSTQPFEAEPSQGNKYFAVIHSGPFSGKLEIADAKLEAVDEETARETHPSELAVVLVMPRLVPWEPLLHEIPAENPVVSFRFFGVLPKGAMGEYDVRVTTAQSESSTSPLAGTVRVRLPSSAQKGKMSVRLVARASGDCVFERTYDYALVRRYVSTPSRRLNNLTVEYYNEPLAAGGACERRLVLSRRGWVFVSAEAEGVFVDGKPVIVPSTPRHETFRELEAGEHVIRVAQAKGGSFVVRGIPELFNYCTNDSVIRGNPPFDWPFVEKYVLPGVTTLNGGKIDAKEVPGLKARGYLWLGNQNSRNIEDDDALVRRLSKSRRINDACYDGVTCDEQYLNQPDVITHYSTGLWKYAHPEGKRVYTWVIDKPAISGVDHDFVAASVNATEGRGKLLTEYYCGTQPTEQAAADYLRTWLKGYLVEYDAFSPVYRPHYGIIFGNYTQAPVLSLWGHPEVDYRYYLDMQFNLIANDPAFHDIACTGVWGSYYAEEEIHRWTFMLMRHYFIEGRREMLAPKYGFRYITGLVTNCDFEDGLTGWKSSGEVTAGCLKGLCHSEGRGGRGDTYAKLTHGETPATVSQHVTGLVPGRDYCLRYVVFDAKDVEQDVRGAPREYALRAVLPAGVTVRKDLSWSHIDARVRVKHSNHAPRAFAHHVVFTANAPTMDLVFSTAAATNGESFALNYVSIHPYLPR